MGRVTSCICRKAHEAHESPEPHKREVCGGGLSRETKSSGANWHKEISRRIGIHHRPGQTQSNLTTTHERAYCLRNPWLNFGDMNI